MESLNSPPPGSSASSPQHDLAKAPTTSGLEKDTASNQDLSGTLTPYDAEKDPSSAHEHDGQSLSQQVSRRLSHQLSRIATSDYPAGLRLAMIVIALVMSMFLVALDMTIVATGTA